MNDERIGAPWWLVALVCFATSLVTGLAVWLFTPKSSPASVAAPPVTVTQTVGVTVTATSTPPSAPAKPSGPQWVVRSPAGLACVFDDNAVTCSGAFASGATGYVWTAGTAEAVAVSGSLNPPGPGIELKYGDQRTAGPWSVTMERSGATFEHKPTGSRAVFSKAGVTVS
ncbi:Uncharacterised protein (plasmid) [Tsukamurella tyrosinosolvens]|uniref:Uncharacterized protein n=1 Tax=Tsukamurella tyrosinosolvens TaxID=57704 RepID=A0A1H4U6K8_TSUTY|nr:hypothetical protein [Tsukamurella tyrosinosolvens]KXO93017.1 hypothetical protein AXK58_14195 [Tsukamurella tyrosinosolvens]SEC64078.1 hypothetical protein SAMN04489793_2791 [Tsukamurella tyrosinosolvens]VEH94010.1 Uncharacterised protein [Tsukamurella tyrosinosolvens]